MNKENKNFLFNFLFKIIILNIICLIFVTLPLTNYQLYVGLTFFLLLQIFLIYRFIKPISRVLNKISKMEQKLPFNIKLELLYKKNNWDNILETLRFASDSLEKQLSQLNDENEKTMTLIESISDSVVAVDPHQNIILTNSKFREYFVTKDAYVTDKEKLWRIFENTEILNLFTETYNQKKTHTMKSQELMPKRYFDISITPLKSQNQDVLGIVGVFHEVTEARLTEKMRVDFVANVSHEIRTPLTSIKGFAQLIDSEKEKMDISLHPYLERILFNSERLHTLFNDLLKLSVIESNSDINIEILDLQNMIESIRDSLEPTYSNKKLTITSNVQTNYIPADKKLFEQVLINLIDNACKYTHENTEIKVSSYRENDYVIISVTDQGPGISQEHHKRIFERFYRVEESRVRSTGGTGLGLSIVKHIINKHKGEIRIESTVEQGTSFIIKLPIHADLEYPLQKQTRDQFGKNVVIIP